jgi:hypothetical protein
MPGFITKTGDGLVSQWHTDHPEDLVTDETKFTLSGENRLPAV